MPRLKINDGCTIATIKSQFNNKTMKRRSKVHLTYKRQLLFYHFNQKKKQTRSNKTNIWDTAI